MALLPTSPNSDSDKRADRDPSQEALLREVDDAFREDQLAQFFKRHGFKVGGAVVAALAIFGGWLWWSDHREAQKEQTSEELIKAMDQLDAGNTDTASQALVKLEKEGGPGAEAVGKLTRAAVALQAGHNTEAARLYGEVADDQSLPKPYRDLATVRQVSLNYESMKPADVVAKLKPLATPGTPFFGSAGEILGAAYLDLGKPELAGPLFGEIAKDKDVPDSLRSRARQLSGLLGVDAIEDVDQTLKDLSAKGDQTQGPE